MLRPRQAPSSRPAGLPCPFVFQLHYTSRLPCDKCPNQEQTVMGSKLLLGGEPATITPCSLHRGRRRRSRNAIVWGRTYLFRRGQLGVFGGLLVSTCVLYFASVFKRPNSRRVGSVSAGESSCLLYFDHVYAGVADCGARLWRRSPASNLCSSLHLSSVLSILFSATAAPPAAPRACLGDRRPPPSMFPNGSNPRDVHLLCDNCLL